MTSILIFFVRKLKSMNSIIYESSDIMLYNITIIIRNELYFFFSDFFFLPDIYNMTIIIVRIKIQFSKSTIKTIFFYNKETFKFDKPEGIPMMIPIIMDIVKWQ